MLMTAVPAGVHELRRVIRTLGAALEGEHGGGVDNRHVGCAVCLLIEQARRLGL